MTPPDPHAEKAVQGAPEEQPAVAAPVGRTVRSAHTIAACTLLSRVLGLVRDVMSAAIIGVGPVMDAFVLAFTVPNLFRRLFGEGALSTAFIPVFTEHENRSHEDARTLLSVCFTWLGLLLGLLAVLIGAGALGTAALAPLHTKGLLFCRLLAILMPYLPLICLSALVAGALQVRQNFFIPAFAPVVLNVFWITGLLLEPWFGIYGLAGSITLGGVAQLGLHLAAVARHGLWPRWLPLRRYAGLWKLLALMGPVVVGLAAMQINVVFDRIIAEVCVPGDGANAALYYGNRLMQMPLGVFGLAIATAAFPTFARAAAAADYEGLRRSVLQALRLVAFITLPCMAVTLVLAEPIVDLVFGRGAFEAGNAATQRTSLVLMAYIVGLWAYCAVHVLSRVFYSVKDTRTPVRIALWATGLNLLLNLTLVWWLREAGLALATAVCSAVNALWLTHALRRSVGTFRLGRALAPSLLKGVAAAVPAAVACLGVLRVLPADPGLGGKLLRVALPMAAGLLVYAVVARLLGMEEIRELLAALRRKKPSV